MQEPKKNQASEKSSVMVYAAIMAFGTMTSRVLGLAREILFAAYFNRTITDAWTAAFRIPNLFRRILGEGSLSVSFIPVFIDAVESNEKDTRAHNLVNSFYTLLLIILAVVTTLGIWKIESVLEFLLDPTYRQIPGKFELTVRFGRIMFGFVFLISTYAYFMAILNALGKYAMAAMAPTLFNVAMIVSTIMPQSFFPITGDGLAWGVLAGGFLQMGILIPSLMKLGYLPKPSSKMWNADVKRVLKSMAGGLIGLSLMQLTTLVNMRFASELGEGSISYIYWADRLLELPLSLVAVSLGAALLPTLSAMWSRGEKTQMSETAHFYLRLNLFVAIPCAIGLYMLAHPIVELLFQRGKFSAEDAMFTAQVVEVYALVLIPVSGARVLAPAYYAVKNTWFPAVVAGFALIVHILIAPWLMKFYGLRGLNFSSFVSGSINFLLLLGCFSGLVNFFNWKLFGLNLLKFLVPAAAMAVSLSTYSVWRSMMGDHFLAKIASLGLSIALSGIIYFVVAHLMKLEESDATVKRIFNKVLKRSKAV
jgi:putative peptidoglycan lipid II flippase